MRDILLISMPWAYHYMPSIQLGVLKAYIAGNSMECDAAHLFLEVADAIGCDAYSKIWFPYPEDGEALYSLLMFPEMRGSLFRDPYFSEKLSKCSERQRQSGDRFSIQVDASERFVRDFDTLHERLLIKHKVHTYKLVGFTLNFGQTVASLYLAQKIKELNPTCRIIFGGAEATGELGVSLLAHFDIIDFACSGEGENCLLSLARAIRSGDQDASLNEVPGLIHRTEAGIRINEALQIRDLATLPTPDYTEYFSEVEHCKSRPIADICSCIPIEGSRGCYYKCTFCALNLQWDGIRTQKPEALRRQMSFLSEKHQILDFFFVDNVTPVQAKKMFAEVYKDDKDYRFFYEIRADISEETLVQMRRAGLEKVQIGIEALSSRMLAKFKKGTRVIQNLQAMKNCFALGITVAANLIIDHPKSDDQDVAETLRTMEIARCYPPPDGVCPFALEVGSPDYRTQADSSLKITENYRRYKRVYPPTLYESLDLPRKEFITTRPVTDWRPVEVAHKEWCEHFNRITHYLGHGNPHLGQFDGKAFLRIEDFRSGTLEAFILDGLERDIYLHLSQIKTFRQVIEAFPAEGESTIQDCLAELVGLKLVFQEHDLFLALAIPFRREKREAFLHDRSILSPGFLNAI